MLRGYAYAYVYVLGARESTYVKWNVLSSTIRIALHGLGYRSAR